MQVIKEKPGKSWRGWRAAAARLAASALPAVALAAALSGRAEAAFVHPGLLTNQFELDFMKKQVAAGAQPWTTAFNSLKSSGYGSLSYKASPVADISCGSGGSADHGCGQETEDSHAVYAQALLWAVTGDERYAAKCAQILDLYSSTVKTHSGSNAPLQIGWAGGGFVRAAEILRYSYPKWTQTSIDAFSKMMKTAYLPIIIPFNKYGYNGNWDAVMIEVMMSEAVFDDNQVLFDSAVTRYKARLPAYIYSHEDGPTPVRPDSTYTGDLVTFWYGMKTYMDGLSQETCRDLRHVQHGFGGLINTAEIAWKQGVDLYSLDSNRLLKGLEFHAQYVLGAKPPANLCGGSVTGTDAMPTWEIPYNHYHNRMGLSMPLSGQVVAKNSPEDAVQHMMYGTLTHHGVGLQETVSVEPVARAARTQAAPRYRLWIGREFPLGGAAGFRILDARGRTINPASGD